MEVAVTLLPHFKEGVPYGADGLGGSGIAVGFELLVFVLEFGPFQGPSASEKVDPSNLVLLLDKFPVLFRDFLGIVLMFSLQKLHCSLNHNND